MGHSFKQLLEHHHGKVTDKWFLYLDEWDRIFGQYQNDEVSILEIGVQNGGSLEIWGKYFVNATMIVGCDIDEKCGCLQYDDTRISVIIGDANADSTQQSILQQSHAFDVIIDDGSHKSSDIIHSFLRYFPALKEGGVYVVEDLHTSYWVGYEGGLYNPYTAMAFFKRIADVINFEHWRNNTTRESIIAAFEERFQFGVGPTDLEKIHSIEFTNSLCVIKKAPSSQNELGLRVIAGDEACVNEDWALVLKSTIQDLEVSAPDEDKLDVFQLIRASEQLIRTDAILSVSVERMENQIKELWFEIDSRNQRISELDQAITEQKDKINKLEQEVTEKNAFVKGFEEEARSYVSRIQLLEYEAQEHNTHESVLEQEVAQQAGLLWRFEQEKHEQDTQRKYLEDEVVRYATSKSWTYTRPFRRIYGFIRRVLR